MGTLCCQRDRVAAFKDLKQILCGHKILGDMGYGDLGVFPLSIQIRCKVIGNWNRMISGNDTKLCFIMYQCLLHLDRSGIFYFALDIL